MIKFVRQILKVGIINSQPTFRDGQSGMVVSISGMPNDGLFVTLPTRGQHLDSLVRGDKLPKDNRPRYKRACDFFVMAEQNKEVDVYLVEAKTKISNIRKANNDNLEDACNQIICTLPILEYLLTMVKVHFHKFSKINKHFVVVGKKTGDRIAKQGVKPIKPFEHKFKNKKFKVIYGENIEYRHLKLPPH